MDTNPPFEEPSSRLKLMYSLPLTGSEARILVIGTDELVECLRMASVEYAVSEPSAAAVTSCAGRFDAVFLPLSLKSNAADQVGIRPRDDPRPLIAAVFQRLRPGGVIVGHIDNLASLPSLVALVRGSFDLRCVLGWRCTGRVGGIFDLLRRAGFSTVDCFYVEPFVASPMTLVSTHRGASRLHFLKSLRRVRSQYSRLGYLLRVLLAHAGAGGGLQAHLFFWARRPC